MSDHAALLAFLQESYQLGNPPLLRFLSGCFVHCASPVCIRAVGRARPLQSHAVLVERSHRIFDIPTLTEMHVHCKEKLLLRGISASRAIAGRALIWPGA